MPKMINPHDRFFKEVFSNRQTAADFLANHLPPEVLEVMDLESLRIRKDSFVDEELRESFSDLLYELKLAGSMGYVYVLFEHKSFPDRFTSFQLLKYLIRIWELHLKQSTRPNLPVILPLVLYQGLAAWKVGHRFKDLLEGAHESLFAYAPDFEYIVCDLSEYSDEEIKGGVMARVMLLAMKYALRDELPEKIMAMLDLLAGLADKKKGLQCLELLFRYLVQATEKLSRQDFEKALSSIPKGGDVMATLAEEWFQEGMEKGRKEGRIEGIKEGRQEGKREGRREGWEKGKHEGKQEGKREGKQEGRLSEAREVILELIEGQFGVPSQSLVKKLLQIQSHEVLRMLRRQLKGCGTIADFEELIEKAL